MALLPLVFALLIFAPAIWSVVSRSWRDPATVSTPTWMAASNAAFVFIWPLLSLLASGSTAVASRGHAWAIVWVTTAYYATLALVYAALWKGFFRYQVRSRGGMSAIATLQQCVLASRPGEVLLVGAVVVAVTTYLNAVYSLNVSGGSDYFKMYRLPYPVVILNTLMTPMTLGLAAAFTWLAASPQRLQVRLAAGLLLVAMLANTIAAGRRELLWFIAMVGLGILWSGRKRLGFAIPFVAVMAYVILFLFAPVFLRARLIYSSARSPGVIGAFRIALEEQRTAVVDESGEMLRDNIASRLNTMDFWDQMYDERMPGDLDGQIITQGIIMSLPRGLVGFWKYRLGASDETVLGTGDICNNVALESWLDLAHAGPLIYGVTFGVVFALSDYLLALTAFRSRVLAILSSSVLIRLLLGPEFNPISCFSEFRTILIYFLFAALIGILMGRRPMKIAGPPVGRASDRPPGPGMLAPAAAQAVGG